MTGENLEAKCSNIRVVITDVDGVLTDGGMYYSEKGDELKKFNVRDGVGVALFKAVGIQVGIMTGESLDSIRRRAQKLDLDFVFEGITDKAECLEKFLEERKLPPEQVAYIGDEINDLPLIGKVGLFLAPADACKEIRDKADEVLEVRGGEGVLRGAAGVILGYQGKLEEAVLNYFL